MFYTVLCEIKVHAIEYDGRRYVKGDFALIPRHLALQYGDAIRILSREEQLQKENDWKELDN